MKKAALILIIIGLILFGYLVFKTYVIFGFWTLVWTSLLTFTSTIMIDRLFRARKEVDSVIIYNPKEWPKFINIIISLSIGYYLYTIINNETISNYDYTFGVIYLVFFTVLPLAYSFYKLIRDRNDFISINETTLKYRDNRETGEFNFTDISHVNLWGTLKGIEITLKNNTSVIIKTNQMNFRSTDLISAFDEIKAKLPIKESEEISEN